MEKIAGAICLPYIVGLRVNLTANQTIDNRLSGRAAKGATLVSRAKCGLLCARSLRVRTNVRAHLAPKKRYQRFSLRAARPAPTKHTSTTLNCKVYGSVFCFFSPFFPVELGVARNTLRNPIGFRAKISFLEKSQSKTLRIL